MPGHRGLPRPPATATGRARGRAPERHGAGAAAVEAPEPDDFDEVDPAEFDAAGAGTDQASEAEARLLEAFPGASEVLG